MDGMKRDCEASYLDILSPYYGALKQLYIYGR